MQRFFCVRCGKSFSETQPFEGLRIEHAKIAQIVKFFSEGIGGACNQPFNGRLTGCHIHIVLSTLGAVGEKLTAFHDAKVRNVTVQWGLQVDELWARVGIRQSRTTPEGRLRDDFYTFLGVDARTKLIVSQLTGKRDYATTDAFAADVASRVNGRVQITCDGWAAYPNAIRKYLHGRLDLAVMQKRYDSTSGEVEAKRRYSPAPFLGVTVFVKAGAPKLERICTSHVERSNLTVRHFNKWFARLGLGWSRKLENHRHAIALFVGLLQFLQGSQHDRNDASPRRWLN